MKHIVCIILIFLSFAKTIAQNELDTNVVKRSI